MTTTESASTEAKTKTGTEVKGKDVVYLNAPEILLRQDADLPHTDKRELIAILNELFQSGGEGDDDWQPPEDWLPVPEPGDYELLFLVNVTNAPNEFFRLNLNYPYERTGEETLIIDWGNGEIVDCSGKGYTYYNYYYPENGQFLIKVTASAQNCHFIGASKTGDYIVPILMAKIGEKIILNTDNTFAGDSYRYGFYGQQYLHYVQINCPDGLPVLKMGSATGGAFTNCVRLRKVDLKTPAKIIPKLCFSNCPNLIRFDFSEVTTIEDGGIAGCGIKKINLPKCTLFSGSGFKNNVYLKEFSAPMLSEIGSDFFYGCKNLKKADITNCLNIGDRAFWDCYRLENIQTAENCTFGTDAFYHCYILYPLPDGATN